MARLPFSSGLGGMTMSISIAGASPSAHVYYEPFSKVEEIISGINVTLSKIDLVKEVELGVIDWTVMMRKFSKIDRVFKVSYDILNFIANALKK